MNTYIAPFYEISPLQSVLSMFKKNLLQDTEKFCYCMLYQLSENENKWLLLLVGF